MSKFDLPELTESHCVGCNRLSWRTVCIACERGDNGPSNLPNDRRLNQRPVWEFGLTEDLCCDDVADVVSDIMLESLGFNR